MTTSNDNTNKLQGWNITDTKELADLEPSERVDLDPRKFDKLIKQKGVRVKVYRSMYCPKVKSIDGAEHEIDCDMCNGSGYIDLHPICTNSFIQNQELEKIQLPEGWLDGKVEVQEEAGRCGHLTSQNEVLHAKKPDRC